MTRAIGVAHFSAIKVPPVALVDEAARAGFASVGLRLFPAFPGAPCYALPEGSAAAREVRHRLDGTGLRLADVEFVVVDAAFDAAALRPVLADAAALGAASVSVCGDDADRERLVASLARLCEVAGTFGLRVDLENMGWRTVATFADALTVVEATGAANCAALADALHVCRNGGTPDTLARAPAPYVRHLQLCDARGPAPETDEARIAEARGGRWAPGEGDLPLGALLAAAPKDAAVSVEVPLAPGQDARAHLARLHAAARALTDYP